MCVLGNGFGDGMGAGFREVICQQSAVVGEWIEFRDREVSFRKRPGLIQENCGGILCVLDRLNGLVHTRRGRG